MGALKAIGGGIKNFMILFSFIVNLILIIVLVVLVLLIFDIKNNVASPLLTGLHSSFVGLDEATIDWTIPVRDTIPVVLNVPLRTQTTVVLTQSVPLIVNATITLPGVGVLNNASVNLSLPAGLELPVQLDLDVPINEELPVSLDVRAVIPIAETQLHDPIQNLRLTFEPLVRALFNLPDNFAEATDFAVDAISGETIYLMADSDYSRDPWPGFSETAGLGYTLDDQPVPMANQPIPTGLIPIGGIPALDELLRPYLYEGDSTPQTTNQQAYANMQSQAVPPENFDGSYAQSNSP